MKVSIQLRKFGKSDAPAKVYFRVREGDVDIKTSSSLAILPEYWDNIKYCYRDSTPTDKVPKVMQNIFNSKVKSIIEMIYDNFHEGVDATWLASIIRKVDKIPDTMPRNIVGNGFGNGFLSDGNGFGNGPKSDGNGFAKNGKCSGNVKKSKGKTGKHDKTLLEYFGEYLETSNLKGKVGKDINIKQGKNGKSFLMFSAFSAEKIGENFAFTWVRFVRFSEEREEWLQPKATVEVKGELEISVYNDRLNLGCKVSELSQWEKKPYHPNN